jgi:hypothetical protein
MIEQSAGVIFADPRMIMIVELVICNHEVKAAISVMKTLGGRGRGK